MAESLGLSRRQFLKAVGAGAVGASLPPLLAACGGQPTPSTPAASNRPATLLLYINKFQADPKKQATLLDLITREFQKQYSQVKVNTDFYATSAEELTKLETAAASHVGPDIFEFGSTLVSTANATGAFEVITGPMWDRLGGKSAFFRPQLTMSGPAPDKTMAVPEYANPMGLVYNKRMFSDAGISKPPTSWDEFIADAQKMTDPARDQWGATMAPADGFQPWHLVWLFSTQLGGRLMDDAGTKSFLDSPEVFKAASFWLDWMARFKIVSRSNATFKGVEALKFFSEGKAAMYADQGPSPIRTLEKSKVAQEWAYAATPTIPYGMTSLPPGGKPAQGFVAGQYLTIFKFSQNKDLALELIKVITSPAIQHEIWKAYGFLPVNLQTYKDFPELTQTPWNTFYTAEENAYPTPFVGNWGNLQVVVGRAISQTAAQIATTGTYNPDDLKRRLLEAHRELEASIKR